MKKSLSLASLLLTSACALGTAGSQWIVRWEEVTDAQLQEKCGKGATNTECVFRNEASGICTVYTVNYANDRTKEWLLGHGVRHCFQGNFHKDWTREEILKKYGVSK